jgi:hypothetical protein
MLKIVNCFLRKRGAEKLKRDVHVILLARPVQRIARACVFMPGMR